jgi:hypothetical protein
MQLSAPSDYWLIALAFLFMSFIENINALKAEKEP